MKISELLKNARYWVYVLIAGVVIMFLGQKCSNVDNGADLNPTEHLIRERVVTDKVTINQIDGVEYLVYQGENYQIPQDRIIQLGESIQDYENAGNKKIVKDIFFDKDSQDFVYRETITTRSYKIEKLKKKMTRQAAWSYVGALILWVPGSLLIILSIAMFIFWTEDIREFRKSRKWANLCKIADWFIQSAFWFAFFYKKFMLRLMLLYVILCICT